MGSRLYPDSCWLAPNGKITRCKFGEHGKVAYEIIGESPFLFEEYNKWMGDHMIQYDPVEFLMEEAGYCRYMNWGDTIPAVWITPPNRKPTKAQINKMFLWSKFIYKD